jgi:uncharacterized membrane protein
MLNLNTMSQGQQKQQVVDNMYPTVFISDLKHTLFMTERSTGSCKESGHQVLLAFFPSPSLPTTGVE